MAPLPVLVSGPVSSGNYPFPCVRGPSGWLCENSPARRPRPVSFTSARLPADQPLPRHVGIADMAIAITRPDAYPRRP